MRQFLDWARHATKDLEIGVEIREDRVVPILRTGNARSRPLEDTLEFVTRVAKAGKTRIVIVLDEFQSIMETGTTVAKLREHAQSQDHASYVIAGSQPTILLNLTRHKSPFWRQLTEFPVGPIDIASALKDASRLTKAHVPDATRDELQTVTRGNTQRLAEILEAAWTRHNSFAHVHIREAVGRVVERHAPEFGRILNQRTPYQRQVLIALALDEPQHPTGSGFVTKHRLRGPAFVQKAMKALERAELITKEGAFVDPLFSWWLRSGAIGPT